jgi:hypothetical protein
MNHIIQISDNYWFRNYFLEIDRKNVIRIKKRFSLRSNESSGYGILTGVIKKTFLALYVDEANVYFVANNQVIDVTSESYTATREKIGVCKYRFSLLHNGVQIYSVDYYDLDYQPSGSFDCDFFGDVVHWLKSREMRDNYLKYWSKRQEKNA